MPPEVLETRPWLHGLLEVPEAGLVVVRRARHEGLVAEKEHAAFMGFQREAAARGAFPYGVATFAFVGRRRA